MVQSSLTAWLNKPKIDAPAVPLQPIQIRKAPEKPTPQLPDEIWPTQATSAPSVLVEKSHDQKEQRRGEEEGSLTEVPLIASTARTLPPNVQIASITSETLQSFKRLITLLLPIPYPDKFYKEILTDEVAASISFAALWHDGQRDTSHSEITYAKGRVVAGIRCRLLAHSPAVASGASHTKGDAALAAEESGPSLYISTIATLSPYRGHGLAAALLARVIQVGIDEYGVGTVTGHVWEANIEGRAWYAKQGFKEVRFEEHYYKRLLPQGAWVLERRVAPSDLIGRGTPRPG